MAVLDASPIIYYSRIGRLGWLKGYYGDLRTTRSIVKEMVDDARELKKPGVSAIEDAIEKGEIGIIELSEEETEEASRVASTEGIEPGDAELLLAAQKEGDLLVTNDRILRTIARTRSVRVHWATTPVLKSARKGELLIKDAKAIINDLVKAGLRLKPRTLVAIYEVLEGMEEEG
jgi:predicted nucleic acid-binding protein